MEEYLYASQEDYVILKHIENGIDVNTIWTKENCKKHDVGGLWWNGVSTIIPHQCKLCIIDNERYRMMLKQGEDVTSFDKYCYITYKKSDEKKEIPVTRRYCSPNCFWFDYFYARRVEMLRNIRSIR